MSSDHAAITGTDGWLIFSTASRRLLESWRLIAPRSSPRFQASIQKQGSRLPSVAASFWRCLADSISMSHRTAQPRSNRQSSVMERLKNNRSSTWWSGFWPFKRSRPVTLRTLWRWPSPTSTAGHGRQLVDAPRGTCYDALPFILEWGTTYRIGAEFSAIWPCGPNQCGTEPGWVWNSSPPEDSNQEEAKP